MIYILDTNIIRTLLDHFPKKGKHYEEVWLKIDEMIEKGIIISSDECYNEIARHYSKDAEEFKWVYKRKIMFKNPDNAESIIIKDLLINPKMRETVHIKNILDNRPSADVYLAAKAKSIGAIVVTKEKSKPNSAQLPNICEKLDVKHISFDDFMALIDEYQLTQNTTS